MKVEISFDDGHISDLRAAKLLKKHGLSGTFYIPTLPIIGLTPMTLKEVKLGIFELGHDIGGHTVNHPPDMKMLSDKQLEFEVFHNMKTMEMVTKRPLTKFAYPRGRHDERVREEVRSCGYKEARTTRVLQIRNDRNDPLQMPTTVQAFPFRKEYNGEAWLSVAERMLLMALETSKVEPDIFFSVWAHTKDLDDYKLWDEFESLMAKLSPLQTRS